MLHKKYRTSYSTFAAIAFIASLGAMSAMLFTSTASALEADSSEHTNMHESSSNKDTMRHTRSEAATTTSERRLAANEKLTTAKLQACEKREANVNTRTERIAERATKQIAVFTKISDRVQTFYTTKGYSLDNYDTLLAEVDSAKSEAEAAVAGVVNNKSSFNCDENPKQSLEVFKDSLRASSAALKNYRTSIKNLIVAVKSANSAEKQDNTSTGEAQ